jgi:tRNA-dihydrouridine synthase B
MSAQAKSFWKQLPLPILGLSPMDGVTDHPFRHIQKKYGEPDIMYTEFTSVEGVCHKAEKLLEDFLYDESQRPIIAQIYGTTPDFFRQTAIILCQLGFDGIDINMGCPAKNVAHSGAGAALIQTPKLALEIIRATKAGVADYFNGTRAADCADISEPIAKEVAYRHSQLPKKYQDRSTSNATTNQAAVISTDLVPVSVKTRVGYKEKIATEWVATLLEESPAAIAVHGRTLKQQYSGSADWEEIARGAAVCKNTDTVYLGNGDVHSHAEALEKVENFNVDGVLLGRAAFGNPFVFQKGYQRDDQNKPHPDQFKIALEHALLFEKSFSYKDRYSFLPMRKHLGWYVKGFPGASEVRQQVFKTNSVAEVAELFAEQGLVKNK